MQLTTLEIKQLWLDRAAQHEDYIAGLEEGWIDCKEFAGPHMTVAEAIEVEHRNVAFCLRMAELAHMPLREALEVVNKGSKYVE